MLRKLTPLPEFLWLNLDNHCIELRYGCPFHVLALYPFSALKLFKMALSNRKLRKL